MFDFFVRKWMENESYCLVMSTWKVMTNGITHHIHTDIYFGTAASSANLFRRAVPPDVQFFTPRGNKKQQRATNKPKCVWEPKTKPEKRLPWWSTPYQRGLKSTFGQILLWPGAELDPLPTPKWVPRDLKKIFKNFLIWSWVEPILWDFLVC